MSCINYTGTGRSWFSHANTISNLHVFIFPLPYFFAHELGREIPGVRKIQQWDHILLIALDELHTLCWYWDVTVFAREIHFQLTRVFSSTTLFFSHDLRWEITGARKIQQWEPSFLIPLDELHQLCWYWGVMVFTC